MYGNDNIFTNSANESLAGVGDWMKNLVYIDKNSFATDIMNRISYSHNIIVFIFLIFLVLIFIFKLFLLDLIKLIMCKCCWSFDVDAFEDINLYEGKLIC